MHTSTAISNQINGDAVPTQDNAVRLLMVRDSDPPSEADMDRLIHTITHDLKGPLHTVKGFAELIMQDLAKNNTKTINADIRRIFEAATKMQEIVDGLLVVSRASRPLTESSWFSAGDMVTEILQQCSAKILEKHFTVLAERDMGKVYGDRIRVKQALMQLVSNALEFTGGQEAPLVEVTCRHLEHESVFTVRDNGMGLNEVESQVIFGVFRKLDLRGSGQGLGLSIARRIAQSHGGRLWVESAGHGLGSSFHFALPIPK